MAHGLGPPRWQPRRAPVCRRWFFPADLGRTWGGSMGIDSPIAGWFINVYHGKSSTWMIYDLGLLLPSFQSWLGRWMSRPIHCPKCRTVQLFCPCSCHWCVEGSTHLLCCLFWRQHVEDSTGLQLHLWIGVSTTENVDAAWRNALHLLESVDLPTQWD